AAGGTVRRFDGNRPHCFPTGILASRRKGTMRNVKLNISFFLMTVLLLSSALATAGQAAQQNQATQTQPAAQPQAEPAIASGTSVNQIVDRIVGREAMLVVRMKSSHPLVETYLQSLDKDDTLAFHPVGDKYFL